MPSASPTSDVTVLGAGRMGAALVRAFRAAGREVTVWNRDPAKAQALAAIGARPSDGLRDAVTASPVVVFCLSDYPTSAQVLAAAGDLGGRTVVQLTTGTPAEADAFAGQLAAAGAESLDGAIMSYPKQVGQPACRILLSGRRPVYDRVEGLLGALGQVMLMGERPGAASAVDGALLFHAHAAYFAYFQGAALLMAQGYDWRGLAGLIAQNQITADSLASWETAIAERSHAGAEATLDVHFAAFQGVAAIADAAAARQPLMSAMEAHFERAMALGHGSDELSAVFETFRPGAPARTLSVG